MLDSNFSFVKTNKSKPVSQDEPQGGGLQLSSFTLAPTLGCLFKNRRTFGEAAASIFVPAAFADE